jgi:molybdate transport system substrate-binding protein
VPAGRYAKAALEGLKLWDQVEKRVIPCESVRAALALVERGEADAGIVYATDAKASKADLESVPLPAVAGVDIRYPVLGVKGLGSPGRSFLRFLWTERAKDAFRKTGFVVRPLSFTPR